MAWLALALILFASALVATTREIGANMRRGSDEIARYEAARRGVIPASLSFAGEQQNLVDCMEMADGIYGLLQSTEAKAGMAATCRSVGEATMRSNPHYGFAALVLARMAAIDGDWPRFNALLRQSQASSATEQWISVERLKLYTNAETHLESETFVARAADIDLLLRSPVGIASIGKLYLDSEHLRARIADQAEKLPEDVQSRFLATLRRMLGE